MSLDELGRAQTSLDEPDKPGQARQARMSRTSQYEPGQARTNQDEPGRAWTSQTSLKYPGDQPWDHIPSKNLLQCHPIAPIRAYGLKSSCLLNFY